MKKHHSNGNAEVTYSKKSEIR